MNVFDLAAVLTLDRSKYDAGLSEAESDGSKFGSGLKKAATVTAGAVAAVGAAGVAAGKQLVSATGDVAEYGDNIDKMSQKMGLSAEAYQEWDAVMQHSGASIDALLPAMKTMASAAESGSDAFQKLGISEEEVKNLSQEDLFSKVISGLQDMESGTERTATASQLLGRGATELGALLNTSAEETQAMKDRVHELGGVMSNEAVKAAASYQDTLQDMSTAFDGLKRNMVGEFMPGITEAMAGLTDIFSGDNESGIGKITVGVQNVISRLSELLPQFLSVGSGIILGIVQSITANLPQLAQAATTVVVQLTSGIVAQLPAIVEAGLQMITTLATGIGEALPELIPQIVEVIIQIVDTLTQPSSISMLLEAAIAIIVGLADGIVSALPKLIEAVPTIIVNFVTAIIDNLPQVLAAGVQLLEALGKGITKTVPAILKLIPQLISKLADYIADGFIILHNKGVELFTALKDGIKEKWDEAKQWGKDLIDNFVAGIKAKFQNVREAMQSLGELIKSLIGFSEPEIGPLSDFHTYAPDMIDLFTKGIRENEGRLQAQVADSFDFADAVTSPSYSSGGYSSDRNVGYYVEQLYRLLSDGKIRTDSDLANIREVAMILG